VHRAVIASGSKYFADLFKQYDNWIPEEFEMLKVGFFAQASKAGKTKQQIEEEWKISYGKPNMHMIHVPYPLN
jgi:hypothetical protein